jgi:hypothetical protein
MYTNSEKEIANLYFGIYLDCIKYKEKNKNKEIKCKKYYDDYVNYLSGLNKDDKK